MYEAELYEYGVLILDEYRLNLGVNFKDDDNKDFKIPATVGRPIMRKSVIGAATGGVTVTDYPLVDCAGLFQYATVDDASRS